MVGSVSIAGILNEFKAKFLLKYPQPAHNLRTLQAIQDCRTPALGGHVHACTGCGNIHFSFHSCRNRHCPQCQNLAREKWVQQRLQDLLPITYFHVVFTLPHRLNLIAIHYPSLFYDLLFKSAWETIKLLGNDPKRLGAKMGMTAVLHTWGQNLSLHPHVHCIVPGGGMTKDGKWRDLKYKDKYLFPIKVLQKVFRGKFIAGLKQLISNGSMKISKADWLKIQSQLYKKKWVVYAKIPFAGPRQVIKYLGSYTHRIAISNKRLIKIENEKIFFHYKDYRDNKRKVLPLGVPEFIRRFCLHILPSGFRRMRHYGILSNFNKNKTLHKVRKQLALGVPRKIDLRKMNWKDFLKQVKGIDVDKCRHCENGTMVQVGAIPRQRPPPGNGFFWLALGDLENKQLVTM